MSTLLAVIREHDDASEFLNWPGDFDLDRSDHAEDVHLASGAQLQGFAGDGAGGTYFFCGEGGEERPIMYADSEGSAGLVAIGVPELLRLLLVAPWWRDCPALTLDESRKASAEYLRDLPDLFDRRDRAAVSLGLELPSESEVLEQLRQTTTQASEDYILIFTPEGTRCEPLFEL
ncbi:hypothetical protein ACFC06_14600 [Nocardia sp. NPDC056064]|uniref:hypothetical protein n=1 Tax=Nocardia sp. NPDC056064 TaxID=3345701 RepID=UPI0035DBB34D